MYDRCSEGGCKQIGRRGWKIAGLNEMVNSIVLTVFWWEMVYRIGILYIILLNKSSYVFVKRFNSFEFNFAACHLLLMHFIQRTISEYLRKQSINQIFYSVCLFSIVTRANSHCPWLNFNCIASLNPRKILNKISHKLLFQS